MFLVTLFAGMAAVCKPVLFIWLPFKVWLLRKHLCCVGQQVNPNKGLLVLVYCLFSW